MSALSDLRVLELSSGVAAEYCGKLLADFGARLIKVEAPAVGAKTRAMEPLAAGGESSERSGLFAYLNTNKQSVVLDPASPGGREALRSLIRTVDVIIDDHPKGWLESSRDRPGDLLIATSCSHRLLDHAIRLRGAGRVADRAQHQCAA